MSIPFFESILHALGRRVNYDAISNYAGNSFAKDAWKMIQEANPLTKPQKMNTGFLDMISGVKVVNSKKISEGIASGDLSDIDWSKV